MILGDICTRSCKFCNIKTGRPLAYDRNEAHRIADAVIQMNLKHVVITMVTRDDLKDGGANLMAETILQIRNTNLRCTIEALISDLKGKKENLNVVLKAEPDILNHNLETVKRLQRSLRIQAKYERSLKILKWAKENGLITKSGLMVGIGEKINEIIELMQDLRSIGCDILTIGQYLPPTKMHFPLARYYHPQEFANLKKIGLQLGFRYVESHPLVRSSYHADKLLIS
jgi:lipoic acid synthetase